MQKFLISNNREAEFFEKKLEAYWLDNTAGYEGEQDIYNHYLNENNYQFIDNPKNNSRALSLALYQYDTSFIHFLFYSEKLKNKEYSLKDLSQTIGRHYFSDPDCVKLILESVKNNKDIYSDYSSKLKNQLIANSIDYFITSDFLETKENNQFFIDFLAEYKIKIYQNQYSIIKDLIYSSRLEILDFIIDNAKNNKDKEAVIYFDSNLDQDQLYDSVKDYLVLKKKSYETYKEYTNLKANLENNNNNKTTKSKI